MRCLCLVLAIALSWRAAVAEEEYKYRINASCCNFDAVLQQALNHSDHTNTSVYISLPEGNYNLNSSHLASFYNWIKLAIVGADMTYTTVYCSSGVGFSFHASVDIVLRNLTFSGCGAVHPSTSRNPSSTGQEVKYLEFPSAVYFFACVNISVEDVTVTESPGTGLVVYNSAGGNTFTGCHFINNPHNQVRTDEHGGGGVVVVFSYCSPGDRECSDTASTVQVNGSTYLFRQCHFENNIAYGGNHDSSSYSSGTNHMGFGKGGALAIHFNGRSKDNSVLINDCIIYGNAADISGGGLYLGFGDQSINNSVHVSGGYFTMNLLENPFSTGAGARVEFIHYPWVWPEHSASMVVNNSVVFNGTHFGGNVVTSGSGGGVSVAVSREDPGRKEATNSLLFEKCTFGKNTAIVGLAVDLSLHHPDVTSMSGAVMEPLFRSCEITGNQRNIDNFTNYKDSFGAIYTKHVPIRFEGVTHFADNTGTAMVVFDSYISLINSSSFLFTGNTGRRGGALAFIGSAWLVAYEHTELSFVNNSVEVDGLGGALYAVRFNEHDVLNTRSCFFRYYKSSEEPSLWNTSISFSGNTAKFKPNSMYVSSVLPCAQNISDLSETFCSHPWVFHDGNCSSQVSTGPNRIKLKDSFPSIVPGWNHTMGIKVYNDYDIEIPAVYSAAPRRTVDTDMIGISKKTQYIADDNVIMFGQPNQSAQVLFTTLEPRVISSVFVVDIQPCPPGFIRKNCSIKSEMVCDCKCANPGDGLTCSDSSHEATLLSYYCLTHHFNGNKTKNISQLVYGECPYNQKLIVLPHNASVLEEYVCDPSNRNGTLCSKCKENYGVDVNSYNFKCIPCHDRTGWLVYLALEILPITVFFLLIAILNISATSAPMNAFVFFSQIASIPFFRNPYPFFYSDIFLRNKYLQASVLLPYAVWNLDFFRTSLIPGVCLSQHMTTIEAIALNYVKALYPMLLILVCYVLIRLYDSDVKVVRWLWKPFHWCLKRLRSRHESSASIIHSFATFLLLSYTKFMFVSFPLLTPRTLYDGRASEPTSLKKVVFYFDASVEFHGKYLVLGVVAGIILAVFVVLPPLLLMAYPWRLFQKVIGRLPFRIAIKIFADAFQGDFRDGMEQGMDCRFFSGLYFLFRIAIFIIFVLPLELAQQYLIQQIFFMCCLMLFTIVRPYKEEFYNKLDTSFFFLLSLMNALSFYSSQVGGDSTAAFSVNYILGLLPLFYVTGRICYLFLLWMGCVKKPVTSKPSEDYIIIGDGGGGVEDSSEPLTYVYNPRSKSEEDIPDRLLNPQNYASRNMYKPLNERGTPRSDSQEDDEGKRIISEASYFMERAARRERHPYGSTSVTEPATRFKGHTQLSEFPEQL